MKKITDIDSLEPTDSCLRKSWRFPIKLETLFKLFHFERKTNISAETLASNMLDHATRNINLNDEEYAEIRKIVEEARIRELKGGAQ